MYTIMYSALYFISRNIDFLKIKVPEKPLLGFSGIFEFIGRSETADLLPPFYTVYSIRRHGGNMQVRNVVVLVPMRLHAPS